MLTNFDTGSVVIPGEIGEDNRGKGIHVSNRSEIVGIPFPTPSSTVRPGMTPSQVQPGICSQPEPALWAGFLFVAR